MALSLMQQADHTFKSAYVVFLSFSQHIICQTNIAKISSCIHGCCEWFWHFLLCKATTPSLSQPVRLCGAGRAKNFLKFHRHPPTNSDQAAKTVENSKKVIFPTCSLGRYCSGPPSGCTSPCREPSLAGGRARPGSLHSLQGTQSTPWGSP